MSEFEDEFPPDENFAVVDARTGAEGQDRLDRNVPRRFYLSMPNVEAFGQLLRLWSLWQGGQRLGYGLTPFEHVFTQLRSVRAWGPEDRVPQETLDYWHEELEIRHGHAIRTEVELWFYLSADRRRQASETVRGIVEATGGAVIDECQIPEIAYYGLLVDLPLTELENFATLREVRLALADDVMFLRPQSLLTQPILIDPVSDDILPERLLERSPQPPIAALFDGVPLAAHVLLDNRLDLDDPDDLQSRSLVSHRAHGTAMASLIIHGDRNLAEAPLSRPLYVRPIMYAPNATLETADGDRLLVDTLYRAVLRMKRGDEEAPIAPSVFLINLSVGDRRRHFTGHMSPFARLLDFLAYRYQILFLVSAGTLTAPFKIPGVTTWTDFEAFAPPDRERYVLSAMDQAKYERTLLSPAEAINALTIGALHDDHIPPVGRPVMFVDPYDGSWMPNVTSALGLGHRRSPKPDLLLSGGRAKVQFGANGAQLEVRISSSAHASGLKAAAPDTAGTGSLTKETLTTGTSAATAIATRAAHRIFDALSDRDEGSDFADLDLDFSAVVVKTLLVHRARWPREADVLKAICGPSAGHRHVERAENVCRFLGYGMPTIAEACECADNRATLVGYGRLVPNDAHLYRIPLPNCLERVTDPRSLTVTLAWFSPVKPDHQRYRSVRFEAEPLFPPIQVLGVGRDLAGQPSDHVLKRGTIFHERFTGRNAVPFIDSGYLSLRVWCKEDAGGVDEPVPYGIAVTIESENAIPIYDQVRASLQVRASI